MTWLGLLLLKMKTKPTEVLYFFLYHVFNCVKALNMMALDIEMCIIVESNLGLEIRKEKIITKVLRGFFFSNFFFFNCEKFCILDVEVD